MILLKNRWVLVPYLLLAFSAEASYARWRWKDLDLGNRNSGIRNIGRKIDPSVALQKYAFKLALEVKQQDRNYDDCVIMVASGISAYGASVGSAGGPAAAAVGAALGAGGGFHAARLACGQVFN